MTDERLDLVDLVIANFTPGVPASITTNPGGLSISVDGRSNWPAYNFVWGTGETHQLSAPLTQVDSKGRMYQFVKLVERRQRRARASPFPRAAQGLSYQATHTHCWVRRRSAAILPA